MLIYFANMQIYKNALWTLSCSQFSSTTEAFRSKFGGVVPYDPGVPQSQYYPKIPLPAWLQILMFLSLKLMSSIFTSASLFFASQLIFKGEMLFFFSRADITDKKKNIVNCLLHVFYDGIFSECFCMSGNKKSIMDTSGRSVRQSTCLFSSIMKQIQSDGSFGSEISQFEPCSRTSPSYSVTSTSGSTVLVFAFAKRMFYKNPAPRCHLYSHI